MRLSTAEGKHEDGIEPVRELGRPGRAALEASAVTLGNGWREARPEATSVPESRRSGLGRGVVSSTVVVSQI